MTIKAQTERSDIRFKDEFRAEKVLPALESRHDTNGSISIDDLSTSQLWSEISMVMAILRDLTKRIQELERDDAKR